MELKLPSSPPSLRPHRVCSCPHPGVSFCIWPRRSFLPNSPLSVSPRASKKLHSIQIRAVSPYRFSLLLLFCRSGFPLFIRPPATPSRRSPTPPTRPSLPAQRSLTPTSRRMNTDSFTGKRWTSPVIVNRGNSVSPKLRGWRTDLPGLATDAPHNLQTSLTDLSATRLHGLSPISGNRRWSTSNYQRHSISPTTSESVTSSHNSGGQFSSISKQSATSSNEDDSKSHSLIGVSSNVFATKEKDFAHARAIGFSKKRSRSPSSSSAPKKSSDLAIRQMYWEQLVFKLAKMRSYRRIVGSLVGSCLKVAAPLVSSQKEPACLVALDIIEVASGGISNGIENYVDGNNNVNGVRKHSSAAAQFKLKSVSYGDINDNTKM